MSAGILEAWAVHTARITMSPEARLPLNFDAIAKEGA